MRKQGRTRENTQQASPGGTMPTAEKRRGGCTVVMALVLAYLFGGGGEDFGFMSWYRKRVERKHKDFFDSLRSLLTEDEKRAGQWLNNACGVSVAVGTLGLVPGGIRFLKDETMGVGQMVLDMCAACGGLFGAGMALQQLLVLLLAQQMHSSYARLMKATALAMPCSLCSLYTSLAVALCGALVALATFLL